MSLTLMTCSSLAQNPQLRIKNGRRFPTVVFDSVFWGGDPGYYSIAIDSSGATTYLSAPSSLEHTGVPYTSEFQVSDRTRRLVFNVTQRMDYFADSPTTAVPTPDKAAVRTLTYIDNHLKNQFSYGNPSGPDMEELTSVLEELSETLECGRKLAYFEQHDQGAVGSQLQFLESRIERHHLRELQALVPLLRNLSSDGRLDASNRDRANKLLEAAQHWH